MAGGPPSQRCGGCPAVYKTATMKPGQRFKCVKCGTIVTVGASGGPSPAAPRPASQGPRPAASQGPRPAPPTASQGPRPAASQGPRAAPPAPSQGPRPAPPAASQGPRPAAPPPSTAPAPPPTAPAGPAGLSPLTQSGLERPAQAAPSNQSLFQLAGLDDELDLLDESGSTEDLASALLASASRQPFAQPDPAAGVPAAPPAAPAAAPPPPGAPPAPPAAAPGSAALPPPLLTIPGYQVGEAIAKGGMATVYKAVQTSLNRPVAIKVLDPDLARNPDGVARFRKEAAVLSALNHNSIVSIIDAGQSGGQVYLIIEYVPGTNLRYLLENVRVPMEKLISYVEQVCEALEYAHQKGVVHRDVKPENIIISRDHVVKLADFGIAGLTADAFGMDMQGVTQGLTKTSVALGTANYIAPEQRKNAREVGPPADVFSTGVVLYEILTGDVPVGAFDPPSKQNPNVPPSFDEVVMRALRNDPKERFPSAAAMLEAIRSALELARNPAAAQPAAAQGPASAAPPAPAPQGAPPPPSGAPPAPPPGGLAALASGVEGPSAEAIAAAMAAAANPAPQRPITRGGGGRNAIDPEAAALLRREQQRKQEEATWSAWQAGQKSAEENREGKAKKKAKQPYRASADGNLRQEVQRTLAKEVQKRDEEFRSEWEAKQAAKRPNPLAPYLRQIPGYIGAFFGFLALVAILGKEGDVPLIRDIPMLRSFCMQFRSVVGL